MTTLSISDAQARVQTAEAALASASAYVHDLHEQVATGEASEKELSRALRDEAKAKDALETAGGGKRAAERQAAEQKRQEELAASQALYRLQQMSQERYGTVCQNLAATLATFEDQITEYAAELDRLMPIIGGRDCANFPHHHPGFY
jgi:chromosome segregation ATPase